MTSKGKIRILHTHQIIKSGGVEQRIHLLCKYLSKERYEQRIVCTEAIGVKPKRIINDGCDIITTGAMQFPFKVAVHKKLIKVIREFKPHIIHGTVYEGNSMAAISGFLTQVPVIILEETSHPIRRSWKANALFKIFSWSADVVIGVSPIVTEFLRSKLLIPEDKIKLIMNGTTLQKSNLSKTKISELRERYNIPKDAFVIGSVGRMDNHVKRFDLIIHAVAKIKRDYNKEVFLILVGDGIKLQEYKQLAQRFNITTNIIFAGFQENVSNYYQIMDLFILASSTESFGLVLIEAWVHSLPIIASNVGGIPYVIDNEINGLLFENGNLDELCHYILYLKSRPDLCNKLGTNGLNKAKHHFSHDRYVKDIDQLYNELINKKFPRGIPK